jgi:hypothetical protein
MVFFLESVWGERGTTKMIIGSCFLAQGMIDMLINGSIY